MAGKDAAGNLLYREARILFKDNNIYYYQPVSLTTGWLFNSQMAVGYFKNVIHFANNSDVLLVTDEMINITNIVIFQNNYYKFGSLRFFPGQPGQMGAPPFGLAALIHSGFATNNNKELIVPFSDIQKFESPFKYSDLVMYNRRLYYFVKIELTEQGLEMILSSDLNIQNKIFFVPFIKVQPGPSKEEFSPLSMYNKILELEEELNKLKNKHEHDMAVLV